MLSRLNRFILVFLQNDPTFKYSPPNSTWFHQPTIRDPYERRTIYVANSSRGRGEGLFAKRDILAGEIAAYLAGFKYNLTENPMSTGNMVDEEM